ncbi:MAG: hypothetical protein AABX83_01355 [Nanoarchaeota archaeon]
MIDIILIIFIFLFINFGLGGATIFYYGILLNSYFKKYYYKRWKSYLKFREVGFGIGDPFKQFSYIYNSKDTDDKKILYLKKMIRGWITYTLTSFLLIIIWMIITVIIAFFQGKLN